MIKNVKVKIVNNKKLMVNFSYLSILQVFNMALPLITYPYLIRVLGNELYGLVIFAQAIITYLVILVNFGFDTTATKEISVHRSNPKKISEIVSSVFIIKAVLFILTFLLLVIILFFLPQSNGYKLLFFYTQWLCLYALIFPQWYFLGLERMKYITLFNLISRILFVVLIFVFIKKREDFLLVPLINGAGAFLAGLGALYIVFRTDKVLFKLQSMKTLFLYLKEGMPFFSSEFIIAFKDKMNFLFIGIGLGMHEVAVYDLGTKIMNLFIAPVGIVNAAIYPQVAIRKDMRFVKKIIKYQIFGLFIIITILQLFLPTIVNFLGNNMGDAILPIRLLLVVPIIMALSQTLARNCLIVNGKNRVFLAGMIITTIFYFLLILLGFGFDFLSTVMAYVVITVMVYALELIYRIFYCKKYKYI